MLRILYLPTYRYGSDPDRKAEVMLGAVLAAEDYLVAFALLPK
jgi:hypothetical protein